MERRAELFVNERRYVSEMRLDDEKTRVYNPTDSIKIMNGTTNSLTLLRAVACLLLFFMLLAGKCAPAQAPIPLQTGNEEHQGVSGAEGGAYTFRAEAKEVLIDVSIRDSKGRLVSELQKSDFRLFVDGIEQPVVGFWFDQSPIAVALMVDNSGSMWPLITEMQKAAARVLSHLKPEDKIALFALDQSVGKIEDLTGDRQRLGADLGTAASRLDPSPCEGVEVGCTDILNGLFFGTFYLKRHAPDMRRVIILVSDNVAGAYTKGSDRKLRSEDELIDAALADETVIYDLKVGDATWHGHLVSMDKIAEQTGGEIISAHDAGKMLEDVVQALRNRYLLSFRPVQGKPGQQHTIELRLSEKFGVRAKKYSVHYRRKYVNR